MPVRSTFAGGSARGFRSSSSAPPIITNGLRINIDAANYVSGANWPDTSGYNNTCTLVNSPTWSSSNGGYFTLNGSNQHIATPDLHAPYAMGTGSTPFTFEVWFSPSISGAGVVLDESNGGWHDSFIECVSSNILVRPFWNNSGYTVKTSYTTGAWYQVALTYDGSSAVNVYVNGSLGYGNTGFTRSAPGGTIYYYLGLGDSTQLGSGAYFNGKISNMKFYNRALTAGDALQNYNAFKGRYGL